MIGSNERHRYTYRGIPFFPDPIESSGMYGISHSVVALGSDGKFYQVGIPSTYLKQYGERRAGEMTAHDFFKDSHSGVELEDFVVVRSEILGSSQFLSGPDLKAIFEKVKSEG